MRRALALLVILLLVAPAVAALNVGTRTVKARESAEYSPGTAYDLGYFGCGVTVAIFDEGVDDKHPHLDGKVVAGVDTTFTQPLWTQANGGNPQPVTGTHGTPVAGLAVSHGGQPFFKPEDRPAWEGDELIGMAPCAWMVDVQFNDIQGASEAEMVAAFDWAIEHKDDTWGDSDPSNDGIEIITMSWSPNDETDGSHPVCQAANRAVAAGIVVLGSAGNSGGVERPDLGCPTGADGAISVANLYNQRTVDRSDDELRASSTWGPRTDDGDDNVYEELKPDIATPGHGVVGPVASRDDGTIYTVAGCGEDSQVSQDIPLGLFSCVAAFSGTSAATPMTAGIVAILLQANGNLTPADVKEILHQSAVPHPDAPPSFPDLNAKYNYTYGYGMADAYAAVRLAETWPGMALGADTDSDGVRDYLDLAPFDPRVTERREPVGVEPAGGQADSDGDGAVDAVDGAPLDPDVASAGKEGPVEDDEESPLPVAVLLLGVLLAVWRRR